MMDNDNSLNKRPTFKRALRNISMTSIFITMMLIWLLLSVTSVLTLKQYAQKNLALTAATMTYSLEAAVVLPMALQQLKHWQRWASKGNFQLQKYVISSKIFWHPGITPVRIQAILSVIS
ncbi:diguanylate cyclase [Escherichia coli]|nr:diguanylate cyclase [Escherichia coli]